VLGAQVLMPRGEVRFRAAMERAERVRYPLASGRGSRRPCAEYRGAVPCGDDERSAIGHARSLRQDEGHPVAPPGAFSVHYRTMLTSPGGARRRGSDARERKVAVNPSRLRAAGPRRALPRG
jgi:hypothetical protein